MRYKCIVVEDNILERDALVMKLKKIDTLSIHAVLADGLGAVQVLKNNDIDIVFSDIDMPDLSGIELLKSLKHPPVFIFISAHSEHAAESFNLDVIDYIVKPVKIERLIKATDKAIEYIKAKRKLPGEPVTKTAVETQIDIVRTIDAQEYFFIKEKNAHIKLSMGDVLYIESMGDFSKIITTHMKTHFVLVSLKNLEKQLPEKLFMRVHKQYIINLLHIVNISAADIKLSNNISVPLSAAYRQVLLDTVVDKKTLTRFGESS
jgi:two-component system LytT family response regulator